MDSRSTVFEWLHAALAACDADVINVPVLQPADPFLDTAGEDLRRRIFMTENENGDSLCLRPEFTIPVCLNFLQNNVNLPRRYGYIGEVYRQSRDGHSAFDQAGIEDIGNDNIALSDARSLFDALTLLDEIKAPFTREILFGDQAVFAAVLNALGLPKGWQLRLLRSFGDDKHLRSYMKHFAKPVADKPLPAHMQKLVEASDKVGLAQLLEDEMHQANISPAAGRTPNEIAARLIEKYELARVTLKPKTLLALETFLAFDVSLNKAEKTLTEFAQEHGLNLDDVLCQFCERNKALQELGIDLLSIRYDAAFGRPLDYYTGMVYEIRDGDNIIVGGGRYDHLMTMLGSNKSIPAVGFSIWLDRIKGGNQ